MKVWSSITSFTFKASSPFADPPWVPAGAGGESKSDDNNVGEMLVSGGCGVATVPDESPFPGEE